ncbi:MAG: DHH family phosphoesterase [Bacteroidales bacterium]|jgi:RecJ-like exonuclease|nr:DHH family phosphoesterase [Bacteroidales bacterium]
MLKKIGDFAKEFLKLTEEKPIRLISHYDTDGITSAAIISKTLKRLNRRFSVRIIKGIEEEIMNEELKRSSREILFFTDLASNSLDKFQEIENPLFIIDHHETNRENSNKNLRIINPHLIQGQEICSAGLCYYFSKAISEKNKDLAKLAIIGMIGDRHEKEISKEYQQIVEDAEELEVKKSLLIFSATRPLRRSLEYSTSMYIPGVTGSSEGALELLRENGISPEKTLCELNEQESSKLITSIMIKRTTQKNPEEILGNIYILKFFNRKEDGREISVLINACSRLGHSDLALSFCLETKGYYERAQDIYIKYRKEILNGLKTAETIEKIQGTGFVILNAREQIKDAIIGTVCSMLSSSNIYDQGTVLIGMAYNQDKIKVSARITGETNKNLKEVLEKTVMSIEAEVGGHQRAAGCLIKKEDEEKFIEELKKNLEVEVIRI